MRCKHHTNPVQLACVKPAASVRSEPGSNSHVFYELVLILSILKVFIGSLIYRHLLSLFIYCLHILFFSSSLFLITRSYRAQHHVSSFSHSYLAAGEWVYISTFYRSQHFFLKKFKKFKLFFLTYPKPLFLLVFKNPHPSYFIY